ncbi:MAG TPA: outer membrane protein assembly factor BamB [Rhodanobacteraceae bacterium]|nr:outer membrane protein assembly factor BamB [Rhodanobacteraceae bacterium]
MKRATLVVAVLALTLNGCTWLKSLGTKDNVEPPHELTEIVPTIEVHTLWTERIGKGAGTSGVRLSPTVVDGRVYAGSVDGSIEAIDARSGETLWSKQEGHRTGSFLRRGDNSLRWSGGPAVAGDLLVVGGLDGQVYAYSSADGSERWKTQVSSEVVSAPAIADGVVVVRSYDGRLSGLDAADGSQKWVFDQSVPPLNLRGNAAPLIAHGVVFAGLDNGKVVALNLTDGKQLWSQTVSVGEGRTEVERLADVDGTLALDGDELFAAGYRGQIVALNVENGRPAWQRDLSSYAGVAVGPASVVVVDSDGNVWAFDRQTGANLWKQDLLQHRWLSAPAIQGNSVVVGDLEGYVHWLSLDEGKLAARERLSRDAIEGPPVVSGDTVYVEDIDGHIGAYRIGQ